MSLADALPALDELVAATATKHHFPSVAWGVVAGGSVVHAGSFGGLDDGRRPTDRTVYRIASMTKSFTAAAILILRDDGVLEMDDPIDVHAPELEVVASPAQGAATIRIRDLLSMSAGIATDDAWADRHLDISDQQLDAAIAGGVLFAGPPGDTYQYSNLGYGLLGRVVKRATGQRVQDLISEQLLTPLGMTRSTWVQPDHDDWARPYAERDGAAVEDGPPLGDGEIAPMGGIWTTVADLARWMAWLDDAHRSDATDEVLSRASRREMQQMHRYIGMVQFGGRTIAAGYGLGLRVRDDPRIGRVITHSGGVPGYGSSMRWLSGRQIGVVALANITYAPMTDMLQAMVDVMADHDALPSPPPVDASFIEQLGRRLVALLTSWDDETADDLFMDNVRLDDSYSRRRAEALQWLEACGGALNVERAEASSLTSGRLAITHPSGGTLWLDLQAGPLRPGRIQLYEFALAES